MALLWIIIFIVSLATLVKGSDWLIKSAERIGVYFQFSPFIIGVLIVGVGTSLPELVSGIVAVIKGTGEIVVANAVGSNIANILLIVGITATFARKLVIQKNLIDSELPLFVIATILFIGIAYDGTILFLEALLLFGAYIIYLWYTLSHEEDKGPVVEKEAKDIQHLPKLTTAVWGMFALGIAGVIFGARYVVESVVTLSDIFSIAPGLISITAIALGTSLPELFVSLKALQTKKPDIAIGNIFGSNAFNVLMVVGLPGLFVRLPIDAATLTIGIPILAAASFMLLVSSLSKTIYPWEGLMLLLFYAYFILRLIGTV